MTEENKSRVEEPQPALYNLINVQDYPYIDAKPFIKWAGGKSRLIQQYLPYFPPRETINRYFEPFLGGGAIFFHLQIFPANLSDINDELINLYLIVKNYVMDLIQELQNYHNDKDFYYEVRKKKPSELNSVERAARFIFLNKTCYNGLYRVNSKGQFNVPFGKYQNPQILDREGLLSANLALENATIMRKSFDECALMAEASDYVYFDPPYMPLNVTSSFTSYTKNGFGLEDQIRLSEIFKELSDRKCFVMLSNSDTKVIRDLYADFHIHEVQAARAINSNGNGRGKITELVITNY
jgi:DNA adenine methylase